MSSYRSVPPLEIPESSYEVTEELQNSLSEIGFGNTFGFPQLSLPRGKGTRPIPVFDYAQKDRRIRVGQSVGLFSWHLLNLRVVSLPIVRYPEPIVSGLRKIAEPYFRTTLEVIHPKGTNAKQTVKLMRQLLNIVNEAAGGRVDPARLLSIYHGSSVIRAFEGIHMKTPLPVSESVSLIEAGATSNQIDLFRSITIHPSDEPRRRVLTAQEALECSLFDFPTEWWGEMVPSMWENGSIGNVYPS